MISDNVIIILIYVCVDKVAMKAQKNFIAIQNKCIYKAISSWKSKHLDAILYPLPQGWPIQVKIGDETTLFIDEA